MIGDTQKKGLVWFDLNSTDRHIWLFFAAMSSLIEWISTNQGYKLLYACDFFCSLEICKKVLNTLEILDFIWKEFVTSDQTHNPWVGRSSTAEGFS